ncbi:MAG: murein hydrolase activator EnvC family protein [Nitriliruptorales bacterium]
MRRGRTLVAVLALLASTFTSAAFAHTPDQTADELRRTRDELAREKQDLEDVRNEERLARTELDQVTHELEHAQEDLAALEAQLAQAQAEARDASRRTADITANLLAETRRLDDAQYNLEQKEGTFEARVAATYKYGTVTYADALVEAHDFSDFVSTLYYVRSALQHDNALIGEVTDLVKEITERRGEIARLREEAVQKERESRAAAKQVAALTAEARTLTEQVASQRTRRRSLVAQLQASAAAHEAEITELEAESKRLAEELRRSRWRAGAPGAGELAWPTNGAPGSGYGWRTHPIFGSRRFHSGVDISGPTGQSIVSAADGLVISSGWRGGYGLAVVIDHGGGLATLYAHQSQLLVSQGQEVGKGQLIGRIGSTGYSTGPHLHFEVRVNGEPKNPMDWY